MAFAMQDIAKRFHWQSDDIMIVNDPYQGGTHPPDVTVISPCFVDKQLLSFVANRAHHADIGAATLGSMPVSSRLEEEGFGYSTDTIISTRPT